MTDQIGCQDNSCIFKILCPRGGMGTNGGCRCFKNLICWIEDEGGGRWNREEVRSVERDTQRLARALKLAQDEAVKNDDHARKQERRADSLEAEIEQLRAIMQSHIDNNECNWARMNDALKKDK